MRPDKTGEAEIVLTQVVSKYHSGPIPPADELEHLERVQKGLADRVVSMAEKEQNMRHTITEKIIDKEFSLRRNGQMYGLIALSLLLCAVGYIAYLGDTKSATFLGSATIIGVVSIFVLGLWIDTDDEETEIPEKNDSELKSRNKKRLPKNNKSKRKT